MSATAITIGAFDGVHRGHAALVAAARDAVGPEGRVVALTFEPHPRRVLRPESAPPPLSVLSQRQRWLEEAGADEVGVLDADRPLLGRSPESFVEWLVGQYAPEVIVEGPDFRFGRARAGSIETLRQLEGRYGYRTVVVEPVEGTLADGRTVRVTSSLIRRLVGVGRVRDAARLLGRPYELVGTVVRGDGRGGADLGVATANLDHGNLLLPADGIYLATAAHPQAGTFPAAVSIGTKPTYGRHPRVCEAHLIGYEGQADDYGWTIAVRFRDWLRDQVVFDDPAALADQIRRDVERARQEAPAALGAAS